MERRSSKLVILGAAVFLVGAGLLFVGMRSGPDGQTPATPPVAPTAPVAEDDGTDGRVIVQGGSTTEVPLVGIPSGHEAVAVKIPFVQGLAGYARAGDRLNVYAAVKGGRATGGLTPPYARLVLRDVEVLDVRGDDGSDPTFLLALRTPEVERLVFFASFESLWASLAPERAGASRGIDHAGVS